MANFNKNQRHQSIRFHKCGAISSVTVGALLFAVFLTAMLLPQFFGMFFPGYSSNSIATGPGGPIQPNNNENAQTDRIHGVQIRKPAGPPRVDTGLKDANGNAITTSCSTCHTTRLPDFDNKTADDLDEFHKNMNFAHGSVSCLSCHNSNDYDALKLADGTRVEFSDVMTLCAQCHGPQMRDFEHGAHGGMNGFWNLKYGPQVKNNCVDCHNPHTPQFPKMKPTFKPKDRFLEKEH